MALSASGATCAPPRKFRTSVGEGSVGTLPANFPLGVWKIDGRLADKDQSEWRMGVRLGVNADGTLSAQLQSPPPGLRRARRRVGIRRGKKNSRRAR